MNSVPQFSKRRGARFLKSCRFKATVIALCGFFKWSLNRGLFFERPYEICVQIRFLFRAIQGGTDGS